MKPVALLLGVIMIILMMAATLEGIQAFRSTSTTEAHGNIVTTSAETGDNVTLTQALFMDRTAEVTSITSNVTTDYPIASSYVSATKKLAVTGLAKSTTRTLTVTYKYGRLDDFYAADLAARSWMMFLVIGVIGVIAAAVYSGTRRGE